MFNSKTLRTCHLCTCCIALVLAACGDDTTRTTPTSNASTNGATNTANARPVPAPLSFDTCAEPLITERTGALCGITQVPLDWDNPTGEQIDLHTFKLPAASSPSLGSIWLLDGGPGGSGIGFLRDSRAELREALSAFDVYIPQHRGAGRSSGLNCGDTEQSLDACAATLEAQWGDRLGHFTTWAAGRDVVHLIDAVRQGGSDDAFVWGGSYGTYWALHALHHAPDQPTGVVLDSALGMDTEFWMEAADAAEVPEFIIDACEAMPSCRANFDMSVSDTIDRALAQLDDPSCDTGDTPLEVLRDSLRSGLNPSRPPAVGLALAARLARCDEAAASLMQRTSDTSNTDPPVIYPYEPEERLNSALYHNVLRNSMFPDLDSYPIDAIEARIAATRLPMRPSLSFRSNFEQWPRFDNAVRVATLPNSDVPMLIMAGRLDQATPYAWNVRLAEHYAGPHQHLLTFDFAGHVVTNSSETSDGSNCGTRVLRDFVLDPLSKPDMSCAQDIILPDFTGETVPQEEIDALFGEGATLFGD